LNNSHPNSICINFRAILTLSIFDLKNQRKSKYQIKDEKIIFFLITLNSTLTLSCNTKLVPIKDEEDEELLVDEE